MNKDLLISRICVGYALHTFETETGPLTLRLGAPTLEEKYYANLLYEQWYKRALKSGMMTDDEALIYLYHEGIWSEELEKSLKELREDIDKAKIGMFEKLLQSNQLELLRTVLDKARSKIRLLEQKRECISFGTAEFIARLIKNNYLALCEIYTLSGLPFCDPKEAIYEPIPLLNDIISARINLALEESQYRLLARSDPWKSVWATSSKTHDIFGAPSSKITHEQQNLIIWSNLYDNIHEFPDCPTEAVINDDDVLDGFLLLKKRERENEYNAKLVESKLSKKTSQGQEVYITANTVDDAAKIVGANDPHAKRTIAERMAAISKYGELSEAQLPDVKRELQMRINQINTERIKQGG